MHREEQPLSERFARSYGSPGEGPLTLGLLRAFWPFLLVFFVAGWLLRAGLPAPEMGASAAGVLLLLLAVGSIFLLRWSDRRLGHFLKGARGEESVARELAYLSPEHTVFNGLRLPEGKQDFDHVVVGPTGVYVIETKNWRGAISFREGRLLADGAEPGRSPLKQVKAATAELTEFLSGAGCGSVVHPVLCFVSTELPEDVMNVNGVLICSAERLTGIFGECLEDPLPVDLRENVVFALRKTFES